MSAPLVLPQFVVALQTGYTTRYYSTLKSFVQALSDGYAVSMHHGRPHPVQLYPAAGIAVDGDRFQALFHTYFAGPPVLPGAPGAMPFIHEVVRGAALSAEAAREVEAWHAAQNAYEALTKKARAAWRREVAQAFAEVLPS